MLTTHRCEARNVSSDESCRLAKHRTQSYPITLNEITIYTEGTFDLFTWCCISSVFFVLSAISLCLLSPSLYGHVMKRPTGLSVAIEVEIFRLAVSQKDTHNIKNTSCNTPTHGSREAWMRYRSSPARYQISRRFFSLSLSLFLSLCLVSFSVFFSLSPHHIARHVHLYHHIHEHLIKTMPMSAHIANRPYSPHSECPRNI